MCARPPGDTVDNAHSGAALISRNATRSSWADENRRALRSTVTSLVWTSRRSEHDCRRDGHDLAVVGLDQLPMAFVGEPMMAMAQKNLILDFSATPM
jgi:hypothetical protein